MRNALTFAVLLTASAASLPVNRWASESMQDVQAFHDLVAANHPGPVNKLDPGFAKRSNAALEVALQRARSVKDYGGYLAVMRGYVASFDDGHVALELVKDVPLPLEWPGFLTAYDGSGRQIVRMTSPWSPVPIGAKLRGCDDRSADELAKQTVGSFRGRWMLEATRGREGFRTFIDNGNPFVMRPTVCTFDVGAKAKSVRLNWRTMSDDDWKTYAIPLSSPAPKPIGEHTLPDGTLWYSISTFDGNPNGKYAKGLSALIDEMKANRTAVLNAPRIVLDLRGNGGGSSDWSRQIAEVLWGKAATKKAEVNSTTVEWRASAANAKTLAADRDEFAASPNASPAVKRYLANAAAGIAQAHAAGRALWGEAASNQRDDQTSLSAKSPTTYPIYVLTDWSCASACLDAVDLWHSLGAVQIGQETSADTLYMDLREDNLPSGLARAAIPMKVYRGRRRGSNVPWTPVLKFSGDMADQSALEKWVTNLPASG